MQIKINNASFGYNGEDLLENVTLEINNNDKIGIIGKNGSGKTTILKILTGEIELHQPDNQSPVFSKIGSPVIGTLNQMTFDDENETLESELLKCYKNLTDIECELNNLQKTLENSDSEKLVNRFSKLHDEFDRLGGYEYKSELASIISSFGFSETDKHKKLCEFSGGQKTKIAFIKLILSKPDVLLLDEPTNHLDIKAVNWLENYLSTYKKAAVIVSHDRTFLDNTINIVYEIEYKKLKKYVGNYSKFLKTKAELYESQLKMHEAQQREIADIKAFIERFRYKATKAAAVQSRVKMLEKMQIIPMPVQSDIKTFHQKIKPEIESGSEVLSCTNLRIGYDKENPLANIDLKLLRGDRLGIIGGNGLGKSTFLNVLTEKLSPIYGHFKFGYNVNYGYFSQIGSKSTSSKTVYDDFSDNFPKLNDREIRSALGSFLFSGNEVNKKLCELSGGEMVRLSLCKILQSKPNLLILDEPTNHLDIQGKETLENMLLSYTGTIIFVSHDRYFTNKIATRLLIFDETGTHTFDGTYNDYIHPSTKIVEKVSKELENKPKKEKIEYPIDYNENGDDDPYFQMSPYLLRKEKSKTENQIKKIEEKSTAFENKLKDLNKDFINPEIASDFVKLMEIQAEMENSQLMIDKLAEEWLEKNELLTKLTQILTEKENKEISKNDE